MTNTTTPQAPAGRISTASAVQGTFGIATSADDTWIEPEMDFTPHTDCAGEHCTHGEHDLWRDEVPTTFAANPHACGWTQGTNGCPNYFPHDRSAHDGPGIIGGPCDECHGTGSMDGAPFGVGDECDTCGGTGVNR
jgi:hypothetical protein